MNPMIVGATVLFFLTSSLPAQQPFTLSSPDKRTEIDVKTTPSLSFSVVHKGRTVVADSRISLTLDQNRVLGTSQRITASSTKPVQNQIKPVVPEKRAVIPDNYNELEISFEGNYGVRFRAYDDGVAYRFFTTFPGEIVVKSEEFNLNLAAADSIYFPEEESFMSHSERLYKYLPVKAIADSQKCSLPALVVLSNGVKLAITEADLLDYPGLYLRGTGSATLRGIFPPYPLEETLQGDRDLRVTKGADYIAKTTGRRTFPWRVIGIADEDADLLMNEIVYRLGSPLALKETDWIKPGKVAWDWWNANNVYGVDFKSGINTATYKYYIDFASKYGIPYIILDEGWSIPGDLSKINPDMNMTELFDYAGKKNVGIVLWMLWNALDKDMDRYLDLFAHWGAKGIKVDFMQRDDQKMVNFYERTVKAAATRHLLVDFHGAYKPTGLRRSYPNLISREGVQGLEQNKWSKNITPKHNVTLPFIRMFAGPMDYTPGAMTNANEQDFRAIFERPMSMGTRCHQLAMYVVFESPLQMLADSPTHYNEQHDAMDFLSAVPTVWDETRVLSAAVGEQVTVARRNGTTWYIGAMTNWTPRDFTFQLSFLGKGSYSMTSWSDGLNADRYASDYRKQTKNVASADSISMHLAQGGGWTAIIKPMKP